MQYTVRRVVRAGSHTYRTVRLVIADVPDNTPGSAVVRALEEDGMASNFSEGGIPWGNHEVKPATRLPQGTTGFDDAPRVTWGELTNPDGKPDYKRVTLRLPPQTYSAVVMAAQRQGQSMQVWCENALHAKASE